MRLQKTNSSLTRRGIPSKYCIAKPSIDDVNDYAVRKARSGRGGKSQDCSAIHESDIPVKMRAQH